MKKKQNVKKDPQQELQELIVLREEQYDPVIKIYEENEVLSNEQLDYIIPIMQSVQYFKSECPPQLSLSDFTRLCCQHLKYEKYNQGQIVFNVGEIGDKFYIVMSGKAGVYLLKQAQQLQAEIEQNQQVFEKMRERRLSDAGITQTEEDKLKQYEKLIKKHKTRPETELLLLKHNPFNQFFTENATCKYFWVASKVAGEYFGEMALQNDQPRAASIIAVTDLIVLTLQKTNYKKAFESSIKKDQEKTEYIMKFFPQMTRFKITKLKQYFSDVNYPTNFYIWKQGDEVDGLLLLQDGEVEVTQTIPMNKIIQQKNEIQNSVTRKKLDKQTIILANLTSGCFIGDNDLFELHDKREYTVKTLQHCSFFALSNDSFLTVKKQFPEFIHTLQQIQMKSSSLLRRRAEDVIRTVRYNFHSDSAFTIQGAVERRYVHEFDQKSGQTESTHIIRSNTLQKLSKQQMVCQNQSIVMQHTKMDQVSGDNEEFNMLRMAGDNFQKCLLIRVEKQFEKFQPAKPKGKTPYFSKTCKDIKDLMEQIKRTQLPQLSTNKDSLSYRVMDAEQDDSIKFIPIKPKSRIINPAVQQKVELIKSQLCKSGTQRFKQSLSLNSKQMNEQYSNGFLLTDTLTHYHPLHSTQNKKTNKTRIPTQYKARSIAYDHNQIKNSIVEQ